MNGSAAGTVLRIEKSSINDGEGLRTVLFLKGCPLRCIWCSTPESQKRTPERGISRDKCRMCMRCVEVCSHDAIRAVGGRIEIDKDKCAGCMKCAGICPESAVVQYGRKMTASEVVREAAKDEVFYFHSGGGLTLSGGEPLMQSEFALEVLRGCSERGINCAMESSFFAPWEKIEPLLPYLSRLYVDIKHTDAESHKRLTGVESSLILENIRRADASPHHFELVVRMPVIPGVNDRDEDMLRLAEITNSLKKLQFVELLAYHRLGTETYKRLDMKYPLQDLQSPSREYMRERASVFKRLGKSPIITSGMAME